MRIREESAILGAPPVGVSAVSVGVPCVVLIDGPRIIPFGRIGAGER